MQKNYIFLIVLCLSSFNGLTQSSSNVLDSLLIEIEFLIGDSWYFEKTKDGFQVSYCKSCKETYNQYLDSTNLLTRNLSRSDFFQKDLIDSVSYYSTVSQPILSPDLGKEKLSIYFLEKYKANEILRFEVKFEKKWTQDKYENTLKRNNQVKDTICKKPLYKTNLGIFSDYRFWLPMEYKDRTKELDFYFERLPYESSILDKSIFILHNKPFYFSKLVLVDKKDAEYYNKTENHLENERRRVLKIIALVLGINDFYIVN